MTFQLSLKNLGQMEKRFEFNFALFITFCFTGAVVGLPPLPPPPPPKPAAAGAPPPPPPPPPPLLKSGSGKLALSFGDAIRQKAMARGGASGDVSGGEKAPPPPPPPAKPPVPSLPTASSSLGSPARRRAPTPFPSPRNSDESAPQPTPIRRRRPTPFVRKASESEEGVRRVFVSEESEKEALPASETASYRRRSSPLSLASSFSRSSVTTPTRSRILTPPTSESEEQTENIEMERSRGWREEQRLDYEKDDSAEFSSSAEFVNRKFAFDKMPESILLGFPLPPSPTGTFPAQFVARDFASGSDVMDYRRPGEADEGRVQEVAISGEFLCGRSQRFHPAAVYLREFFWESGVRDRSGTFKHPKFMKRIVGLYALRPTFGSFTFKIVRPAASYQVHNGDDSEPKMSRKNRRRWRRGGFRVGKKRRSGGKELAPKGEEGEWPVLEAEHSQFELVFDRGGCDSTHNESEALSEGGLCLSEFARKPDWQDRKWRKALDSERKCSTQILDRKRDRICVQKVGDVRSDADFVEKSLGPIRVDKCTVSERMSFEFCANFKCFDGAELFLPEMQPHEQFFMRIYTAFAQFLPFCDVSPTNDGHTVVIGEMSALFPGLRRLFAVFLQLLAEAVPRMPMQNY
uniref:Uncharacterized protein n=1 Tax=Globodera rostochiensis TaxID=31243 RepID=A0A914HDN0_GLORO